ncbi:probable transcription factor GLK2 isoform X2 [Setaria viridis]|uniref:HTH myb-type domain-containing protein n=1 Tax=Setaria viridis TaxID=4556 RepID=A0A4U6U840_SETVI|nr:probable transcription factor GLK2 isoform X2 [Setaria viridis]TKW11910.1 hypothetical protein SEVIR_5G003100v2 [Setaria viridis]
MLEVSSLRSPSKAADQRGFVGDHVGFPTSAGTDDFMVDDNLLDYIDFSSCCDMPFFDADGDILPDLEVDPTESLLAEFSSPETSPAAADGGGGAEAKPPDEKQEQVAAKTAAAEETKADDDEKTAAGGVVVTRKRNGDEVTTTEEDSAGAGAGSDTKSSAAAGGHSKKKASAGKDSNGKRKVDWTPELHRRFVQAVEQLGIDKAVPSRILEIMGIEGLTRHNIASHLQKYRSHRKHLMAREAEAATWAQKRQLYAAAPVARKVEAAAAAGPPWVVPTIGFPPPPPPAMAPPPPPFCRPLHVWGHPPTAAVEAPATMLPVWPRHLAPPRPWVDPGYWHQQYNAGRTKWAPPQAAVTQGTPCVPPPPAMVQLPRFPHPMYSRPPVMVPPPPPPPTTTTTKLAELQLQLDAHPSKESIDAAIGDVLVKPWLPLPLGLKPPSLDSVMSELHKQGIPKIPPASSTG